MPEEQVFGKALNHLFTSWDKAALKHKLTVHDRGAYQKTYDTGSAKGADILNQVAENSTQYQDFIMLGAELNRQVSFWQQRELLAADYGVPFYKHFNSFTAEVDLSKEFKHSAWVQETKEKLQPEVSKLKRQNFVRNIKRSVAKVIPFVGSN